MVNDPLPECGCCGMPTLQIHLHRVDPPLGSKRAEPIDLEIILEQLRKPRP